ncbi:hypothetical protein BH11ACT1_BH11ACT1_06050 [soil metagenome]
MVDHEAGRRGERVRAEPSQVAVARHDQEVHVLRRGHDLPLDASVPLLDTDLAARGFRCGGR